MMWYVLQVLTGSEQDVCKTLRRKGVTARAPVQKIPIRRRGQWKEEDHLLLPGYVFVGVDYSAALFHVVSPVAGVIRWLGMENGKPQALDTQDAIRWQLYSSETLESSRVLFMPDGSWNVLDGPLMSFNQDLIRMERRQHRAYVTMRLGGTKRRVRFGVIPVTEDSI